MKIHSLLVTGSFQVILPPEGTNENKVIVMDDTGSFKYRTGLIPIASSSNIIFKNSAGDLSGSSYLVWDEHSHTLVFVGQRELTQSLITITSESRLVVGSPSQSKGLLNIQQASTINYADDKPTIYLEGKAVNRSANGHYSLFIDDRKLAGSGSASFQPFKLWTTWGDDINLPGDAIGNMTHILGWGDAGAGSYPSANLIWEQRYSFGLPATDENLYGEFHYEVKNSAGVSYRPFSYNHNRSGSSGLTEVLSYRDIFFPPYVSESSLLQNTQYARENFVSGTFTYYRDRTLILEQSSSTPIIQKRQPAGIGGGLANILTYETDGKLAVGELYGIAIGRNLDFRSAGTRPQVSSSYVVEFNQGIQLNEITDGGYHLQFKIAGTRAQTYLYNNKYQIGFNDNASVFSVSSGSKVQIGQNASSAPYFDLTFSPNSSGFDGAFAIYDSAYNYYTRIETLTTGEFAVRNGTDTSTLLVYKIIANSVTASLQGTASFASSASFAVSASWAPSPVTASGEFLYENSGKVIRRALYKEVGDVRIPDSTGSYFDLYRLSFPSLQGDLQIKVLFAGSGLGNMYYYEFPLTYAMDWINEIPQIGYSHFQYGSVPGEWVKASPKYSAPRHMMDNESDAELQFKIDGNDIYLRMFISSCTDSPTTGSIQVYVEHSHDFSTATITEYFTSGSAPTGSQVTLPYIIGGIQGTNLMASPLTASYISAIEFSGSLDWDYITNKPSLASITASNGLIQSGNYIALGDDSEGSSNPGRLLSDRYINLNGKDINFAGSITGTSSLLTIDSEATIIGNYSSSNEGRIKQIAKFRPLQQDQGNTDFVLNIGTFVNTGTTGRNNDVAIWGWNAGGGGSPLESGKAMVAWAFENGYNPTGTTRYQEVHLLHTDVYGTARRPITLFLNEADVSSWSTAFHVPRLDLRHPDTLEPYFQVLYDSGSGNVYIKIQDAFTATGSLINLSPTENALTIGNIGMTDPTLYLQQYWATIVDRLQARSLYGTPSQLLGRDVSQNGWIGEVQTGSLFIIDSGVLKFHPSLTLISSSAQIAADISGSSPWKLNGTKVYYLVDNVGIGTDTPTNKLMIQAFLATTSESLVRLSGGSYGFGGANDANTEYTIIADGCSYSSPSGIVQRDLGEIAFRKQGSWNEADNGFPGLRSSIVFRTQNGTIATSSLLDKMIIAANGDITFNYYTSSRNDSVTPSNFLYTDSTGSLRSKPLSQLSASYATTSSYAQRIINNPLMSQIFS